jgi:hypothetical protein
MSGIKAWGVPLYTSTELLEEFKGSTLFPDTSSDTVIVVGADTFVWAKATKKIGPKKLYLIVDTPIICRGAGLELNGIVYQPYGRYMKAPLKHKPPESEWALPQLNSGEVLKRNAKRIQNLVKMSKGAVLKSKHPFNTALSKVKEADAAKRKAKKAEKAEDETPQLAAERDE